MRRWSRRGCCRSGPGSRSRSGRTSRWRTCCGWRAARRCSRSGPRQVRARWAGHRAAASEGGGDAGRVAGRRRRRGDRLRRGDGPDRDRRRRTRPPWTTWSGCAWNWTGTRRDGRRRPDTDRRPGRRSSRRSSARPSTCCPAPAGWPSFLRRRQLGARLDGPEPAAGHRVLRVDPGRDPQRGHPARQALPVGRAVRPARRGLPGAPHQAQGRRRPDRRSRTASCCAGSTTRS